MGNTKIKDILNKIISSIKAVNRVYLVFAALAACLLFVILVVLLTSGTKRPTAIVTNTTISNKSVGSLEVDAKIKGSQFIFNNQVYYTPVTINNITPGTYVITAHNNGYQDENPTVTIETQKKAKVVLVMAEESVNGTPAVSQYVEENESAFAISTIENQRIQQRAVKYPLTQYLPEAIGSVLLDYDVNPDESVQYVVRPLHNNSYVKADYTKKVDDFIQAKGFDPQSIQLVWK